MAFLLRQKRMASRKGAAVELAIMVMVLTVSLSIILLTTSLLQHSKQLRLLEEMERSMVLEQIGEDFIAAANEPEHNWIAGYPDYEITINGLEMSVKKKNSDRTLLRVCLENDAGAYRITVWQLQ